MTAKSKISKKRIIEEYTPPTQSLTNAPIRFYKKLKNKFRTSIRHVIRPLDEEFKIPTIQHAFPDPYVGITQVVTLPDDDYDDFLKDKDAVMIFYYEPTSPECKLLKRRFKEAAKNTVRYNHAYAAVNCSVQRDICDNEVITSVPAFKLFARGRLVGNYDETVRAAELKKFVESAPLPLLPVMTPPPQCRTFFPPEELPCVYPRHPGELNDSELSIHV